MFDHREVAYWFVLVAQMTRHRPGDHPRQRATSSNATQMNQVINPSAAIRLQHLGHTMPIDVLIASRRKVASTGTTMLPECYPMTVTKISTTIDGRTYSARITQAKFSAYVEVWGDGWDYAENIATSDAMAAMKAATRRVDRRTFPAAHADVLRMAAVICTRCTKSTADAVQDLDDGPKGRSARDEQAGRSPTGSGSRRPHQSLPRQRSRTEQLPTALQRGQ